MPNNLNELETEMGMGTFISSTNPKMKPYEGKTGFLFRRSIPGTEKYVFFFDMIRYWIQTSVIKSFSYRDSTLKTTNLIAMTENGSEYVFRIEFAKDILSPAELMEMISPVDDPTSPSKEEEN